MPDLRGALDDLAHIRGQVAKSSQFRGFGPLTLSASGCMALLVAATQGLWLKHPAVNAVAFVAAWSMTALCAITVIGTEALYRARRAHGCMALPLLQEAARHFYPALVAGALLTIALLRADPTAAWMLPGLWEILFSFGAFAMAPLLPRPMFAIGIWYLLCGLICIQRGPADALSGWSMGIPFGVGQLMVAWILLSRQELESEF